MFDHGVKQVEIGLVIALIEHLGLVEVQCEDVGIFIDGAVLNSGHFLVLNGTDLGEPAIEKMYLKVEGPFTHIFIEISKIRVVFHAFEEHIHSIMFSELLCQACLSRPNISTNCHVHGAKIEELVKLWV